MDIIEQLRTTLYIRSGGMETTTILQPPVITSEVVRAWFAMTLQAGHHIDNVLDELETILEEYRGMEFTVIDDEE